MYDFFLGGPEEIAQDEDRYLLAIKRMLPRYLNGIPDSELLAIFHLVDDLGRRAAERGDKLVIVETGVGASTIAMIYCAVKHGGHAYTWDMNPAKASMVRQVVFETIGQSLEPNIHAHWKHVPWDSTSKLAGLPVLADLHDHVDYFCHDADHVWITIKKELEAVDPLLRPGSVVAIDDAQYAYLHTNEFIVNVLRKKLGLGEGSYERNRCAPIYEEVQRFLEQRWYGVANVAGEFRELVGNDIFYPYYRVDREVRQQESAEFTDQERRWDAWRLSGERR